MSEFIISCDFLGLTFWSDLFRIKWKCLVFVLNTLQVRVHTTPPDVLSSVKKLKPLFRGPVLLKKCEPSLRGEWINTQGILTPFWICAWSSPGTWPPALSSPFASTYLPPISTSTLQPMHCSVEKRPSILNHQQKKKLSPSTLRTNVQNKEQYLKEKAANEAPSSTPSNLSGG